MDNLLILYNPYYQKDVIEQHVRVLQSASDPLTTKAAFGKIRSKLRDYDHPYKERLETIFAKVSGAHPLQLFLTDYADMYVARVVEVTAEDRSDIAPDYYNEKNLDVELWFVMTDLRRIVRDDFTFIRDRILSNFTTPNFKGWHYAIYGNEYVYPLVVEMDEPIDYFDYDFDDQRYFPDIFKNDQVQRIQRELIHYRFGEELFYAMHPNVQDALVGAEAGYVEHRDDPLYDFSPIVVQYSKAFERELYRFGKRLFGWLGKKEDLTHITYAVQGQDYTFADYQRHKPNIGTTAYLLRHYDIRNAVDRHLPGGPLKSFVKFQLQPMLKEIQEIRNEATHGEKTSKEVCENYRAKVVGVGESGLLADLVRYRLMVID